MFDAPGELGARPEQMLPAFARAQAGVRVRFSRAGGRTVRSHGAEWGGFRARFPDRFGAACECVLVNTGGGMAGGDSYEGDFALDAGADAVVTTQAAEKIYRSQGPATRVSSRITMAAGPRSPGARRRRSCSRAAASPARSTSRWRRTRG